MGPHAEYDPWADYYDIVHEGLNGEAEFYVGQAIRIAGRTLELGCGTGRIAIPMAMSGVDVTGLDNAPRMLERCREKLSAVGEAKGKLHLVEADMTTFDLGKKFSFICLPYRTFMHLDSAESQRACLGCVRKHLEDDGVLAFNVWMPEERILTQDEEERFVEKYSLEDGYELLHYHRAQFDTAKQMMIEEHRLVETDAQGKHIDSMTLPLVRRWSWPDELKALFEKCNLRVLGLFGDFDCSLFNESSTEMIWVLGKED